MRFGSEAALEIQVTEKFFTNADGKTPPVIRKSGTRAVEEAQAYASSTQAAWQMKKTYRLRSYQYMNRGSFPVSKQRSKEAFVAT